MLFERKGIPLPVLEPVPVRTPCDICPKNRLWPDDGSKPLPGSTRGLHPDNELAVRLYYYARDVQRVGTFDGAPLMRTITLPGVQVILDEFAEYMPTWMARQNMLTKILILDEVATDVLFKDEESKREARRRADEAKRKNE